MLKTYTATMHRHVLESSNNLLNDTSTLDRIEERRERQRRYYANMSADKKNLLLRRRKEARAKKKAANTEIKDSQIGKVKVPSNV